MATENLGITSAVEKEETTDLTSVAHLEGKYMTFRLADEEYGVEILRVRELIKLMDITRVPRTKEFIRGVINLRGRVIPVVDLRLKIGMGKTESTDQTVIVIVQFFNEGKEVVMGILVDEVLEVLDIKANQIEPPPNFGAGTLDNNFILGIGKSAARVIMLVDIDKVLSAHDVIHVSAAADHIETQAEGEAKPEDPEKPKGKNGK